MEKWEIEQRIKYLEALNEDPAERPEVKKNRLYHIEFFKNLLKQKQEEDEV